MYIRHLEQIFSIDKVVLVGLFPVFWQILLQCYLSSYVFMEAINFFCRSLLLSTTVLNDNFTYVFNIFVASHKFTCHSSMHF